MLCFLAVLMTGVALCFGVQALDIECVKAPKRRRPLARATGNTAYPNATPIGGVG